MQTCSGSTDYMWAKDLQEAVLGACNLPRSGFAHQEGGLLMRRK